MTRRSFCALATCVGAAALMGLAGCEKRSRAYYDDLHEGDGWHQGVSVDTERSDNPCTLTFYADERFQRFGSPKSPYIDQAIEAYNISLPQTTIKIVWCSPKQIQSCVEGKIPSKVDAVIGLRDVIVQGVDAGYLCGGVMGLCRRDFDSITFTATIFRKRGSKAQMPKADTYNGEDYFDLDGTGDNVKTRMQRLGKLKGTMAIAAEDALQGQAARSVLAEAGLYSEASGKGGKIDVSVRSKIKVFPSAEDVVKAVEDGECALGLAFRSDIEWLGGDKLEEVYEPPSGSFSVKYSGASVIGSEQAAQARDFMQFLRDLG